MESWYAVQIKPRQELLAEENLQRQSFNTYLPRIQVSRRVRKKKREVIEPLFPGYLFLSINLTQKDTTPIRSTRGVVGLVKFGNQPRPVPDTIIQHLKQNEDAESGLHISAMPEFKKGDKIQIAEGPFEGLDGIFKKEKGEDRALILIDILGKQSMVTLKQNEIAPAP